MKKPPLFLFVTVLTIHVVLLLALSLATPFSLKPPRNELKVITLIEPTQHVQSINNIASISEAASAPFSAEPPPFLEPVTPDPSTTELVTAEVVVEAPPQEPIQEVAQRALQEEAKEVAQEKIKEPQTQPPSPKPPTAKPKTITVQPAVKATPPKKSVPKKKTTTTKSKSIAKTKPKAAPKVSGNTMTTAQKNTDANREKLLSLMKNSLENLNQTGARGQGGSGGSGHNKGTTRSIGRLASENIVISGGSASWANELAAFLKHALVMPERGDVQVKLTLSATGKFCSMTILTASSDSNRKYVEKRLPTLNFPSQSDAKETVFHLTLKGD